MAEVWDENWFGSTKTLDVHVSALRRKLGDDPVDPRYLETVRGVGFRFAPAASGLAVRLQTRLLLAIGYVLVVALVAFLVPLAINYRERTDSEVQVQASGQGDLLAVTAAEDLREGPTSFNPWSRSPPRRCAGGY